MTDRKLDYLPLDEIRRNPANPKGHAGDLIEASIGRLGFMDPALLDERTGLLIGGHGRLDALEASHARGDQPPDGIRKLRDGRWAMPVVRGWASADDAEAARALVVLNRATELGGWQPEPLRALLADLPDLELTGWASLDDLPPLPEPESYTPADPPTTNDEMYTPGWVFERLGLRFDLDVCAPLGGGPHVPTERFFTIDDDGLAQPWLGRVWMNPPYSKPAPWVERFIKHRHGVALVPFAKSAWFFDLWDESDAICTPGVELSTFVNGPIYMPCALVAFGQECVSALGCVGTVRVAKSAP